MAKIKICTISLEFDDVDQFYTSTLETPTEKFEATFDHDTIFHQFPETIESFILSQLFEKE
jgi:hypothetical protein